MRPVITPHIPAVAGKPSDARKDRAQPTVVTEVASSVIEEAEVLHGSLKAGSIAQIVIATIATIGLLYFLTFVLVTSLLAVLLAFILEPLVSQLQRIAIPRAIGAMAAVITASVLAGSLGYFLFNQLNAFSSELPQYSARIRQILGHIEAPISRLESNTRSTTTTPENGPQAVPVRVEEAPVSHFLFSTLEQSKNFY